MNDISAKYRFHPTFGKLENRKESISLEAEVFLQPIENLSEESPVVEEQKPESKGKKDS